VLNRPLLAAIAFLLLLLPAGCIFQRGMSAEQVANFLETSTNGAMSDVVCTTNDTNGWKYSCSYTDPHNGTRWRVGADIIENGPGNHPIPRASDQVPVNDPLPPPPS
jgi:hypothetical protein